MIPYWMKLGRLQWSWSCRTCDKENICPIAHTKGCGDHCKRIAEMCDNCKKEYYNICKSIHLDNNVTDCPIHKCKWDVIEQRHVVGDSHTPNDLFMDPEQNEPPIMNTDNAIKHLQEHTKENLEEFENRENYDKISDCLQALKLLEKFQQLTYSIDSFYNS